MQFGDYEAFFTNATHVAGLRSTKNMVYVYSHQGFVSDDNLKSAADFFTVMDSTVSDIPWKSYPRLVYIDVDGHMLVLIDLFVAENLLPKTEEFDQAFIDATKNFGTAIQEDFPAIHEVKFRIATDGPSMVYNHTKYYPDLGKTSTESDEDGDDADSDEDSGCCGGSGCGGCVEGGGCCGDGGCGGKAPSLN